MFGEGCYERDSVFDCSGTSLLCNVLLLVFCGLPWGCTVLCIFFPGTVLIFIIFFLYTSMCCVFRFFSLSKSAESFCECDQAFMRLGAP